jgi:hypothetical protein
VSCLERCVMQGRSFLSDDWYAAGSVAPTLRANMYQNVLLLSKVLIGPAQQ